MFTIYLLAKGRPPLPKEPPAGMTSITEDDARPSFRIEFKATLAGQTSSSSTPHSGT
jgi:hypothetical protein